MGRSHRRRITCANLWLYFRETCCHLFVVAFTRVSKRVMRLLPSSSRPGRHSRTTGGVVCEFSSRDEAATGTHDKSNVGPFSLEAV
jgi:hypothetical protein